MYRILADGVAVHDRYRDKIVMLDGLSSEIWLRIDGKTTLRTIARDIAGWGKLPVDGITRAVAMIAVILSSEGVLYQLDQAANLPYHLTMPQEDQNLDLMRESLAASGWLDD